MKLFTKFKLYRGVILFHINKSCHYSINFEFELKIELIGAKEEGFRKDFLQPRKSDIVPKMVR